MVQGKSSWPSTDASLSMQVRNGHMPTVTASASMIHGSESVFARIEVDTFHQGEQERHIARFALMGPRAEVLAVLAQLYEAAKNARPEEHERGLGTI